VITGSGDLSFTSGTLVLATAIPNKLRVGGILQLADSFDLAPEHFEVFNSGRLDLNGKNWNTSLPLTSGGVTNSAVANVTISGTVNTADGFTLGSTSGWMAGSFTPAPRSPSPARAPAGFPSARMRPPISTSSKRAAALSPSRIPLRSQALVPFVSNRPVVSSLAAEA
jgi:hypothetical protein